MNEREISNKVMGVLTSRKYGFHQRGNGKNAPKRNTREYEFFLRCIEEKLRKQKPVEFFINFTGLKNYNACKYYNPDESEKRAFSFLLNMAKQIEKIYPQGVVINIISNDARAMFANGAKEENCRIYYTGLEKMIKENESFSKHFRLFHLKDIWQKEGEDFFSLLSQTVAEVEKNIENDPDFQELLLRAKRSAKPNTPDHELKQAVVKFKATLATEKELRIWDKHFPHAIMLSYRINPAWGLPFLLPWATGEGEVTHPWHGWYDKNTNKVMTVWRQEKQKELQKWMFRI
ncbi:isocyanide synthase family protein [Patescibacteria group bacterium]|nr:isocyanide synthase family protein [Patescibacteria group bacterium]